MIIKRSVSFLLLSFIMLHAFGQQAKSFDEKPDHFSLAAGAGWSHYFNNLKYGDKNIKTNFSGISFRFFWETEYLLGLGFESGYYRLFRVKGEITPGVSVDAERAVIPLMMLVRMRIIDHVYLGTGLGYALLTNKSPGGDDPVKTTTLSLSNYQASASYILPVSKHLRAGGEMKVYNYGSLNDWVYSLEVFFAVRF
jgi:hypothetical protein